jgi:radical SAM protein with 4Fe4S-binding SPASM domain
MVKGLMRDEVFKKVLLAIKRNREFVKVAVLYHGGEPFLNKHFFEFVSRIKEINNGLIFVKTVSNGMLLSPEYANSLIACGIDQVEFSLDGDSAEQSQEIRCGSNSAKIISNINSFINLIKEKNSKKPEIYIATTQFLKKAPEDSVVPEAAVPAWLLNTFGEHECVKYKSTYAVAWPDMVLNKRLDLREVAISDFQDSDYCAHVLNTVTIRANGNIVPCCYDLTDRLIMGNINEEPLEQIWNNKNYQLLRKSIKEKKYNSTCASCFVVKKARYLILK